MVGPGGSTKFTFTAARIVMVTQSYNDKNESTIRLVTYLKMTVFSTENEHMKRKRFECSSGPQSLIGLPNFTI